MRERRIKIEFHDSEGGRYAVSVDGRTRRDKLAKIMDMVEELEGTNAISPVDLTVDTTFNKTFKLIEEKFALGSFTSLDLLEAYEDEYSTPTKLSTVSTYLARLVERGHARRERVGNTWVYKRIKVALPR